MTDWATISALATAGGTLVLAVATFSSVRSGYQAARATERALLASIRPVLMTSRLQDEAQKVGFMDDHWVRVEGGRAEAEVTAEAIYVPGGDVGFWQGALRDPDDPLFAQARDAIDARQP